MIFIPSKNIYTPLPYWQRGSVSVTVFSNAAQQGQGPALDTTVTVGSGIYDTVADTGGTEHAFAYGFDDGADIVGAANPFGDMGDKTYTDGGSNARTIMAIHWSDNGVSGTPAALTNNVYFGLVGATIPDTNTTFVDLTYNGVLYTRTSRTTHTQNVGSANTFWQWDNVATSGPTTGTVSFVLTT